VYEYRFQIREVYDGDTVKGVMDMGRGLFFGHPEKPSTWDHLRLLGCQCPEVRGAGKADGLLVRDWVRKILPVGTWVTVRTHLDREEGFGRLLAMVVLDAYTDHEDGQPPFVAQDAVLNSILLAEGFAIPFVSGVKHPGLTEEQRTRLRALLALA
jgi:endonuclease YncB( thermonuclease family)